MAGGREGLGRGRLRGGELGQSAEVIRMARESPSPSVPRLRRRMRPSCAALSFSSSHAQHAELVTPYSRYNLWTEQGFAKSKQPRPGAGASSICDGLSAGLPMSELLALEAPPRCVLWRGFALSAPQ